MKGPKQWAETAPPAAARDHLHAGDQDGNRHLNLQQGSGSMQRQLSNSGSISSMGGGGSVGGSSANGRSNMMGLLPAAGNFGGHSSGGGASHQPLPLPLRTHQPLPPPLIGGRAAAALSGGGTGQQQHRLGSDSLYPSAASALGGTGGRGGAPAAAAPPSFAGFGRLQLKDNDLGLHELQPPGASSSSRGNSGGVGGNVPVAGRRAGRESHGGGSGGGQGGDSGILTSAALDRIRPPGLQNTDSGDDFLAGLLPPGVTKLSGGGGALPPGVVRNPGGRRGNEALQPLEPLNQQGVGGGGIGPIRMPGQIGAGGGGNPRNRY